MRITPEFVLEHAPSARDVENLVGELRGAGLTRLEVLELDVPWQEQLWLLCLPGVLSKRVLRLFTVGCAERALRAVGVTDERCWNAVDMARKCASGMVSDNVLNPFAKAAYMAYDESDHDAHYATFAAYAAAFADHDAIYAATAALTTKQTAEEETQRQNLRELIVEYHGE
jgi:hypothetical protein